MHFSSLEPCFLLAGHPRGLDTSARLGHLELGAHRPAAAEIRSRAGVARLFARTETPSDTMLNDFDGIIGTTPDGWQRRRSLTPVTTSTASTIIFGTTLHGGSSRDGIIFIR